MKTALGTTLIRNGRLVDGTGAAAVPDAVLVIENGRIMYAGPVANAPEVSPLAEVIDAAARNGVALEINCNPERLDLSDSHARLARDRGVKLVISTDAHSTTELDMRRWGVLTARRAWLTKEDVLTAQPLKTVRKWIKRRRP